MRKRKRLNRKQKWMLIVVACCVLLAAGGFIYHEIRKNNDVIRSGGNIRQAEDEKTVTYDGKKYTYNRDLKNILFLGVDKREEVQIQAYPGRGGQSDTILLLSMDKKKKTTRVLQISRDSMVNLKIYDADGNLLDEKRGQLALQYAYGDGEKKSCRITEEAVSELLYGVPVDGYISLNMDGIGAIVDALGGVEMTFDEDYTYVEPEYQKGVSVVLDGASAERFVRYRDINMTGSNNVRMERQTAFVNALLESVKSFAADGGDYGTLLDSASPYMVTDLTAEEMKAMAEYQTVEELEKIPGKTTEGEEHDEYHVDDEELYRLILDMFYTEAGEE